MAIELGAGYVSLTVEAKNVARDIKQQISQPVMQAMEDLGKKAGNLFAKAFKTETLHEIRNLDFNNLDQGFGKLGTDAGNNFAREFKQEANQSFGDFGRLGTDAGNDFARQFRQETDRSLGGVNLGHGLDESFGRLGTNAGNDFARQFKQETRSLGDSTSSHFGAGFASHLGTLGRAAGAALAVGVVGAVGAFSFAKGAVDVASSFVEQTAKINVVFGDSAEVIKKWSEISATAMGLSRVKALEAAGTFGNLFRAVGIAEAPASEMSVTLTQLAADLGSFNNVPVEDALFALRAGLVGEQEPMRRFGVNITEARLKAEAFRLGLVEAEVDQLAFSRATENVDKTTRKMAEALTKHGEGSVQYTDAVRDAEQANAKLEEVLDGKIPDLLTAQQKSQAAYSLIIGDTALAQGDFERTSGHLANQQKILGAEFENLKEKIGTALMPAALRLVVALRTKVLPVLGQWADVFARDVIPALGEASDWIGANIVPVLKDFGGFLRDDVLPVLQRFGGFLRDDVGPALGRFGGFLRDDVLPVLQLFGEFLRDDVGPVLARFGGWIRDEAVPAIQDFAEWLGPRLVPALSSIRDGFAQLGPKAEEMVRIFRDEFLPAVKGLWERFERDLLPILKQVGDRLLTETLPAIIDIVAFINGKFIDAVLLIIRMFGVVYLILGNVWDQFKFGIEFVRSFVDYTKAKIGDLFTFMGTWGDRVATIASGLWEPLKNGFRDVINIIIGWWNGLEFQLPTIQVGRLKYGGNTISPPQIEPLATGGVITRPTLGLLGETSRATPEIVAPQRLMAETVRNELQRFSPTSNMAPVKIEHFHSTEPSRTLLEEMQWRIATGVL